MPEVGLVCVHVKFVHLFILLLPFLCLGQFRSSIWYQNCCTSVLGFSVYSVVEVSGVRYGTQSSLNNRFQLHSCLLLNSGEMPSNLPLLFRVHFDIGVKRNETRKFTSQTFRIAKQSYGLPALTELPM